MNTDSLEVVVRLAYEFGPFLFAILFLLSVTRTAHKWFFLVSSREKPPATRLEQITYQGYFLACCFVGISFSIASVVWWFEAHRSQHVYVFAIQDVSDSDVFSVDNAYTRKSYREMNGKMIQNQYDAYFMITKDSPFIPDEEVKVKYWNINDIPGGQISPPAPHILPIHYHTSQERYQLIKSNGAFALKE